MEITTETYEKRCVELARQLGADVEQYSDLPEPYRDFFGFIGYVRICSLLVIGDLHRGRSERELARRYCLTRKQIQYIKERSGKKGRRAGIAIESLEREMKAAQPHFQEPGQGDVAGSERHILVKVQM